MGFYIEGPAKGKVQYLIENHDAEILTEPEVGAVCVVDNGMFEAAGYCFNSRELEVFTCNDGRPRTWLRVPNAAKLAGYEREGQDCG